MIKIIKWKWLANEKEQGKYLVLFNHILLSIGKWKGLLWNISKVNKKGFKLTLYLGKFLVSFIKDDYKTHLSKCNCKLI